MNLAIDCLKVSKPPAHRRRGEGAQMPDFTCEFAFEELTKKAVIRAANEATRVMLSVRTRQRLSEFSLPAFRYRGSTHQRLAALPGAGSGSVS